MGSEATTFTNHAQIRRWAECRGGVPVMTVGAQGQLLIHFPDETEAANIQAVDWDDWFRQFDALDLALLCQEETVEGEMSRFHKLVHR